MIMVTGKNWKKKGKKGLLYVEAVSDTMDSFRRIWFDDKDELGPIGKAILLGTKVMSTYNVAKTIKTKFEQIGAEKESPFEGLTEVRRAKKMALLMCAGKVKTETSPDRMSYKSCTISEDLTIIFVTSEDDLLSLKEEEVSIFVTNYPAYKDWVSDLIWSHAIYGLRLQKSDWLMDGSPIKNPPDRLFMDSQFEKSIQNTVLRAEKYIQRGLPRKILLWGPPGTGKSTISHKMSLGVVGHKVLCIPPHVSFSKEEFEGMMPKAVVIDDIDRRSDAWSSLMSFLESLDYPLLVICTLNTIKKVDPAMIRSGRFDEVIRVDFPHKEGHDSLIQSLNDEYGMEINPSSVMGIPPAGLKELFRSLSIVGMEEFDLEVSRLRFQANMSSEEVMNRFLLGQSDPYDYEEEEEESSESLTSKPKKKKKKKTSRVSEQREDSDKYYQIAKIKGLLGL